MPGAFNDPDPRMRVAFDAAVEKALVLNVACWEWDTGDGNLDSFGEALIRLNNDPIFSAIWAAAGSAAPTLLGLLMDLSSLAVTIISYIAKNDLSASRSLYLDQLALAALSKNGSAQWHFNGDGYHELKVKFTGSTIPFPVGTLEYAVRTGSAWGTPVALPFESLTPPALASYNGKLYALFVRADRAVMWTRLEADGSWRTPERVGGQDGSSMAPAVTVAHGKLYYAVTGDHGIVWWRTYTEAGGWGPVAQLGDVRSAHAPALAAHTHNGREGVFLSRVGTNGKVYTHHHNGSGWGGLWTDTTGWIVPNNIALGHLQEHLWRVTNGYADQVFTSYWIYGQGWHNVEEHPTWRISHTPALATHDNLMWILMRGTAGPLWVSACDNKRWTTAEIIPGAAPMDAPAAASHNNKLYVMYRR
ncbi:hypothetical protein [Streptomyces virginiae]|uniref:hypothetical protein n=1 Tax=Streptomyces virginiae TaxID=1961 RepID=UPI003331DD83